MQFQPHLESSRPVVFRNNRFLIVVTLTGSVTAIFMSLCMLVMTCSVLFLQAGRTVSRIEGAIGWAMGTWAFFSMGPALWKLARNMAFAEARLDQQGVDFRFGTKSSPLRSWLAWNQIAAIKHQRIGNNQTYSVISKDQSTVQYTSYTFFRPKKLARLIAAHSGRTIQET